MTEATTFFIVGCWLVWGAYWLITAFGTKRTIERGGLVGYRAVAFVLIVGLVLAGRILGLSPQSQLWHTPPVLAVVCACLVAGGLAFTIWARVTLGRNWSAEVTFKQGHELIETGPYALARHPIYSGLIAMMLGTALNAGRAIYLVIFIGVCGALWWKARDEERMMSSHFPDAYAEYRTRVHAIVPFVL
jgi:protein-S-isoprenylcysteine O-methyltransferase Ste14